MTKEERGRHYIACGKTDCDHCLMTPCVWDKHSLFKEKPDIYRGMEEKANV